MRANLVLRPPVVILPLPQLEQIRLRVVLASRRIPQPRVMLPVLLTPVVRLLKRVAVVAAVPFRAFVVVLRAVRVLAVRGARPPPDEAVE
jgi:hypothetical protein